MSDEKKDMTPEDIAAMRERYCLPPLSAEDMAELVRINHQRAADNAQQRPTVDPEDIRLAREAYARGEGIDMGDVLKELVRENQEWGMYDDPPGPRTGEK